MGYPFRNDGEHENYFTERQWAKKGYILNSNAISVKMRPNRNCTSKNGIVDYYTMNEVHKATDEEIRAFFAPERERRNERRKELERLREEKREERIDFLRERIDFLEKTIEQYRHICSNMLDLIQAIPPEKDCKAIVIDTETTGLEPHAGEILQLSIISAEDGTTLYNSYFCPVFHKSWDEAERINGISPDMVANAPHFYEEIAKIRGIIGNARTIIGYNTFFDLNFLLFSGISRRDDAHVVDVMKDFAPIYGEWNDYYEDWKWQKLTTCADYYDYTWGDNTAHNSLSVCRATLYCYKKIIENKENENNE